MFSQIKPTIAVNNFRLFETEAPPPCQGGRSNAEDEQILPSVSLLVPEFLRYVLHRMAYYYPPNLPKEMLSAEVKTGQVDHKLWIAIEDIHDGWEQSGTVGQEVYGAGVAFGVVPRHFYKVPNEDFIVYCIDLFKKFSVFKKNM